MRKRHICDVDIYLVLFHTSILPVALLYMRPEKEISSQRSYLTQIKVKYFNSYEVRYEMKVKQKDTAAIHKPVGQIL